MSLFRRCSCVLVLAFVPHLAMACDAETGQRQQSARLMWGGEFVAKWDVRDGAVHEVALPGGPAIGVRVEEASSTKYRELARAQPHVPEAVSVEIFEMVNGKSSKRLTQSWAGANSVQQYGADGGADRVPVFGSPGIHLVLLKPVCAR